MASGNLKSIPLNIDLTNHVAQIAHIEAMQSTDGAATQLFAVCIQPIITKKGLTGMNICLVMENEEMAQMYFTEKPTLQLDPGLNENNAPYKWKLKVVADVHNKANLGIVQPITNLNLNEIHHDDIGDVTFYLSAEEWAECCGQVCLFVFLRDTPTSIQPNS